MSITSSSDTQSNYSLNFDKNDTIIETKYNYNNDILQNMDSIAKIDTLFTFLKQQDELFWVDIICMELETKLMGNKKRRRNH